MKYKIKNKEIEIDESIKNHFKEMMGWSEEDFEKYTIKKEDAFNVIVKDNLLRITTQDGDDIFIGTIDGYRFQDLKKAMEKMENE